MATFKTVRLDEGNKIPAEFLPPGAGGPQEWSWHFPGTLTVRTGLASRKVPSSGVAPTGTAFTPIRLIATLGTIPTATTGAKVRARLAANGSTVAEVTIVSGNMDADVALSATVTPGDFLTIDILEVTTTTPVVAGDLTVALWWGWV